MQGTVDFRTAEHVPLVAAGFELVFKVIELVHLVLGDMFDRFHDAGRFNVDAQFQHQTGF